MTVKELIERLSEFPDEAPVYLQIVEPDTHPKTRKLKTAIFYPWDATVYLQYIY